MYKTLTYLNSPGLETFKQTERLIESNSQIAKELEEIKTSYEKQLSDARETIEYERKLRNSEKWFDRLLAIAGVISTVLIALLK